MWNEICLENKTMWIAGIIGGVGILIGAYCLKRFKEKTNQKPYRQKIFTFEKQLKHITEKTKQDKVRPVYTIFQLLFKISMQKIVYFNQISMKKRRTYIKPDCLQDDRKLQLYLSVTVEEFINSKANAGKFMAQEMAKFQISKDIFARQAGNKEFINFKAKLKRNCLEGLVGFTTLRIFQLEQVLNLQIECLSQKGQKIINKIGYAVVCWSHQKKAHLLKTFSLIILDISLAMSKEKGIQKLRELDEIDVQYAKSTHQFISEQYQEQFQISEKIDKLELLRKSYNGKLKDVLNF